MDVLIQLIEALLISFNLSVISLLADTSKVAFTGKGRLLSFAISFVFFIILYGLFLLFSFFPALFVLLKEIVFSFPFLLFQSAIFIFSFRQKLVSAFQISRLLLVFWFFIFVFGREEFRVGGFGIHSLSLLTPQNPVLTLAILWIITVDDWGLRVGRKVFLGSLLFFLLVQFIGVYFVRNNVTNHVQIGIASSWKEPLEVITEEQNNIYIVKNVWQQTEIYFTYSPKPILKIPPDKRQIFKHLIDSFDFPVIEQVNEEVVLIDLQHRFMGKYFMVKFYNGETKISGPLF